MNNNSADVVGDPLWVGLGATPPPLKSSIAAELRASKIQLNGAER